MKQNYFVYNNVTYPSGTIIIVNKFNNVSGVNKQDEMTFCYHTTDNDLYVCKIKNACYNYKSEQFYNMIVCVTDKVDAEYVNWLMQRQNLNNKSPTFSDELAIDGMFIAWMWYVFIMVTAIIFKDRIAIWIFSSIIFFNYRKNKIKGGN